MNEQDLYADDWMGVNWSEWLSLDPIDDELIAISTDPGLYRVAIVTVTASSTSVKLAGVHADG